MDKERDFSDPIRDLNPETQEPGDQPPVEQGLSRRSPFRWFAWVTWVTWVVLAIGVSGGVLGQRSFCGDWVLLGDRCVNQRCSWCWVRVPRSCGSLD